MKRILVPSFLIKNPLKVIRLAILLIFILGIEETLFCQTAPVTTPVSISAVPNGSATVYSPTAYTGSFLNYVTTYVPRIPITDDSYLLSSSRIVTEVNRSTQYSDGLGRPIQTVNWQASPNMLDIVSPQVYNSYGREEYKFLPYRSTSNDGSFKTTPFSELNSFYSQYSTGDQPALRNEAYFYSHTQFELSEMNRTLKEFAVGNSWAGSEGSSAEHSIQKKYMVNDGWENIPIWTITNNSLTYTSSDQTINIPTVSANYATAQLYKNVTLDEKGIATIEYKDKEGKLIMKKIQIGGANSPYNSQDGNWYTTYYVYDDLGLLRFVIPPKAVIKLVNSNTWDLTLGGTTYDLINELCYRYEYDSRQRMIAKKIPGTKGQNGMVGWVYMIYDLRDRLVYTQDPNMLANNYQWNYILYDDQNRPTETGMINYNTSPSYLQSYVNSSSSPIPSGVTTIPLTQKYYDDYSATSKTYSSSNNGNLDIGNNIYGDNLPSSNSIQTRGVPTVSRVRVIEDPSNLNLGAWLETAVYYDEKGRPIQSIADNYKGGQDLSTTRYNFNGKVISSYLVHNNPAASVSNLRVKTNFDYDQVERILTIAKQVNDNGTTRRLLTRNSYDGLGMLLNKQQGQKSSIDNTALNNGNYNYNIRGWFKGNNWTYSGSGASTPNINYTSGRWFAMDLSYDWGYNTSNQFNGNIAGQRWETAGDLSERSYGYGYDQVNRLLYADFNQNFGGGNWNKSSGNFNIDFTTVMGINGADFASAYDENGNIKSMSNKGLLLNTSDYIDKLTYSYKNNELSNRLRFVSDAASNTQTGFGDFKPSANYTSKINSGDDYDYDGNGNLNQDLNKDIHANSITYNHLNLPYVLHISGVPGMQEKGNITYIYDASGNKLEKRVVENSPLSKTTNTDYLSGFVYENNALQFFGHEEGRVRINSAYALTDPNAFVYDYFIKDHLGNTRMTLTDEQRQDVYPAATLEDGAIGTEQSYYSINTLAAVSTPSGVPSYANNNGNPPYNSNPNSNTTATSLKMYKLNGLSGDKSGLGFSIKVMVGDNVSIFGKSYWTGSGPNNGYPIATNDLLNAFALTSGISTSPKGITGSKLTGSPVTPGQVGSFLSSTSPAPGNPKAFINWILFDDQFQVVSSNCGADGLNGSGQLKNHQIGVTISKNGYLYVYCSNESNIDVFFDNLQVVHNRGRVLDETHYYPFGLTMAGISSKAGTTLENKFKFNSKEKQASEFSDGTGLEEYDYGARFQDPQLGRWSCIDPMSEKARRFSPYTYTNDNPVRFIDPDGMMTTTAADGTSQNQVDYDGIRDPVQIENIVRQLKGRESLDELANAMNRARDGKLSGSASDATEEQIEQKTEIRLPSLDDHTPDGEGDKGKSIKKGPRSYLDKKVDEFVTGVLNDFDVAKMTLNWFLGTGPIIKIFKNDRISNELKNSPGVNYLRNLYYSSGSTFYHYDFGGQGLIDAGLSPVKQFVGSYDVSISRQGNQLQFTITNVTSLRSADYHITPQNWNPNFGPMRSVGQIYIFNEPIRK